MACEVICCEVDHMIDNLVAMKDGEMIHRIFSLLDTEGDLDDRLSGYFEKVRTQQQIGPFWLTYLNNGLHVSSLDPISGRVCPLKAQVSSGKKLRAVGSCVSQAHTTTRSRCSFSPPFLSVCLFLTSNTANEIYQ